MVITQTAIKGSRRIDHRLHNMYEPVRSHQFMAAMHINIDSDICRVILQRVTANVSLADRYNTIVTMSLRMDLPRQIRRINSNADD